MIKKNLNDFLDNLKKDAEHELRRIENIEKDEIKRSYSCALALVEINARLKTFIVDYEFADEREEINFFKSEKPELLSWLIYYCEAYNIGINRPMGGDDVQREYLHRELEGLQNYIERCPEFYSYYRLGSTDDDVYYFTRGAFEIGRQHLEPVVSEREPRYSTNCDYKLANIQAIERLEVLLKSKLDELEHPEQAPQLSWMTKKAFLIELLYALDSFRAFGRVSLKMVVAIFQKLLGVNLGNYTSIFAEMSLRDNPTPFLDGLKDALLHRMKRSDGRKKSK